ncbi:hypothetical protein [Arthrobacter sp. NtRootA1]|uniref:family 43 glycosylhydrolase n=1 Tax=Arthrobacter sp. NtRootA1 TaxID=2830983 RepID=UPI001CC51095|nr:hypothetical protein [Arthrobacter sp. NtRootA1]BCW05946.1 hypothetical protein NtRootA1_20840 [Arthrobacter sp. NtRootA1]
MHNPRFCAEKRPRFFRSTTLLSGIAVATLALTLTGGAATAKPGADYSAAKSPASFENIQWESTPDPVFTDPDDGMAKDPSIFFAKGQYYMFYTGTLPGFQGGGQAGEPWTLEFATSPDGVDWTKQGTLLEADCGGWEACRVQAPSKPIFHQGKFYMFYTGGPRTPTNIIYTGYATSTDLVHWTKEGQITQTVAQPQNVNRANDMYIFKDRGSFYMFYTTYGTNGEQIFKRESKDLVNWSEPELTGAEGEGTTIWKEGTTYYLLAAQGFSGLGEDYHLYGSSTLDNFQEIGLANLDRPSFASGSLGHGDVIDMGSEIWFYFQGTNDGGKTFDVGLAKHKKLHPN